MAIINGTSGNDLLVDETNHVTLAVGEHVRAPRTYRGKDIQWWMDATGLNDERYDQVENLRRARNLCTFQIAGYAAAKTST
jgi:putative flavoprotein involved in K+ transport